MTIHDRIGLVRPALDAHSLGISSFARLLEDCGVRAFEADEDIRRAVGLVDNDGTESAAGEDAMDRAAGLLSAWVKRNGLTVLGFSYRLDPERGAEAYDRFIETLHRSGMSARRGGPVRELYFAGLPETCRLVSDRHPEINGVYMGDESPQETLVILGLPPTCLPNAVTEGIAYDEARTNFGKDLIRRGEYFSVSRVDRSYSGFGTAGDSIIARVRDGVARGLPPVMRAHVGPYLEDRKEAIELFRDWTRRLARGGLLDVLSIGTSQLTQERFGEDWGAAPNGGGVPIQSAAEYAEIWRLARPMLVRTYAGTRNVPDLARMHEKTLHNAWHTLSLWWFCRIDGRGPNGVLQNLREHIETLRYIAAAGKPFEPNVPHHFAFRGCDDASCVAAGYIAVRAAKETGIRTIILQTMLNTPKGLWGVQDLAKARALLGLVRELEDREFHVLLQPRGGLDYFSRDEEKAKIQLAAVTALMDDIEPWNSDSPPIIHVVGYSEANRLADPAVVEESIRITRAALVEYRKLKAAGGSYDPAADSEANARTTAVLEDARTIIRTIESVLPDPYSPEGLYAMLEAGFFPLPRLSACRGEFGKATAWETRLLHGSVRTVDERGLPLSTSGRIRAVVDEYRKRRGGSA